MADPLRSTLLIFTLGEAREARRRRLLPPAFAHLERRLYRRCLDEALEAGRRNQCRPVVAAPRGTRLPAKVSTLAQPSGRFSERIQACLDAVSTTSQGPVILLGTDTPGVSARHIEETLAALDEVPGRVVVGPATDGGLYLLAAGDPLPDLSTVAWCTKNARSSLVETLRAAGREVFLLEELADLDSTGDLEDWLSDLPAVPLPWWPLALAVARVLARHAASNPAFDAMAPLRPRRAAAGPRAPPV